MLCDNCEQPFDPVRSRWLCPNCGFKANCCEGAPLELNVEEDHVVR